MLNYDWNSTFVIVLSGGYVEATLLYLIFHIATFVYTHIAKHLAQYPFQLVVTGGSWNRIIPCIWNIESGAIHVAAVLRCIPVVTAQNSHVLTRSGGAGHDEAVQRNSLHLKTVEKSPTYVVKKRCCTRHKIRYASCHRVDVVIRICADIHKRCLAVLRISTILNRLNTILLSRYHLQVVGIGEGLLIVVHTLYLVLLECHMSLLKLIPI